MSITVTGRLVSWLAARGYLGDSAEYWRGRLRAPGPRGGRHLNSRIAQIVYLEGWTPEYDNLLDGIKNALDAKPCGLKFNSVNPAKRAICQLEALKRSNEYAKDHTAQSL